jgi:hypothetical protein
MRWVREIFDVAFVVVRCSEVVLMVMLLGEFIERYHIFLVEACDRKLADHNKGVKLLAWYAAEVEKPMGYVSSYKFYAYSYAFIFVAKNKLYAFSNGRRQKNVNAVLNVIRKANIQRFEDTDAVERHILLRSM